jgi:hypothetical protein
VRTAIAILGAIVVLIVIIDVFWTTMGEGGGPLTRRWSNAMWKGLLRLHRLCGYDGLLTFAGVIIAVSATLVWIVLLWTGWFMIFNGSVEAVEHGSSGRVADIPARIYFSGYTIFTLGVGDYVPKGSFWQFLTAVASLSGLFLVTFSITYIVPVAQAATQKRHLALYIHSIGMSPQTIILNTWRGDNCDMLGEHLTPLTEQLAMLQQQHLTYPVLHYFHAKHTHEAAALAVSVLDEALTILEAGIERDAECISRGVYGPARQVITELLFTLDSAFIDASDEAPPPPKLDKLREAGIPVVGDAEFQLRLQRMQTRRRLLRGLVENDGWTWGQMDGVSEDYDPDTPLADKGNQKKD